MFFDAVMSYKSALCYTQGINGFKYENTQLLKQKLSLTSFTSDAELSFHNVQTKFFPGSRTIMFFYHVRYN